MTNAWTPSFCQSNGSGGLRALTDSTEKVSTHEYGAFDSLFQASGSTLSNYVYR